MFKSSILFVVLVSAFIFFPVGIQEAMADCNDAGWDEDCLDRCDREYEDCWNAAWGEYLSCKVWGEEAQCWQYYQEDMVTCGARYVNCEDTCRCYD